MSTKRHTPEQIINKLRQAEVEIAGGAAAARTTCVSCSKNVLYEGYSAFSVTAWGVAPSEDFRE